LANVDPLNSFRTREPWWLPLMRAINRLFLMSFGLQLAANE